MMHQWESLQKLVKTWEEQEVDDPFVYKTFQYELEEWDNVPPVIPRFVFYIQNCIMLNIKFSKEVHERQTTLSLKNEINGYLEDHLQLIKSEESSRIKDISDASARKDDIQSQVDGLKKYNKDQTDMHQQKGQEDLTAAEYLKLLENFDQKDSEEASPTFEDSPSKIDWSDAKLNEPRQLTLKNVRDIFFALMNQSRAQKRICKAEDNITKLWDKCGQLTNTTETLDQKIDKTRADLDAQHKIFYKEFENTKERMDDTFEKLRKDIRNINNKIEDHNKRLDNLERFSEQHGKNIDKLEQRINKNKSSTNDDINKLKDEMNLRIDELEKN